MRRLTIPEFHAELKAQGVEAREDCAFVCPMCKTVQSMRDFVAAGRTPEQAELLIGFSCVGRVRPKPRSAFAADPGEGRDWTLGGLLKLHHSEVIDERGKVHPTFEPATPAQAQTHAARHASPHPVRLPHPELVEGHPELIEGHPELVEGSGAGVGGRDEVRP